MTQAGSGTVVALIHLEILERCADALERADGDQIQARASVSPVILGFQRPPAATG